MSLSSNLSTQEHESTLSQKLKCGDFSNTNSNQIVVYNSMLKGNATLFCLLIKFPCVEYYALIITEKVFLHWR